MSATRLTKSGNDTEVTNLRINKSQIPFELDTYIGNNISLDIAKYYFTIPFFPSHHFIYGGVLEINRTVVVCLSTYISFHRTRVEFLVP